MTLALTLERRLDAPPALVFRALIEPALLRRWMCPEGWTCAEAAAEPRPGGRFRVAILGPEGARHAAEGRFVEVAPPRRLALTWRWTTDPSAPGPETTLRFALDVDGSGTRLTLTHEGLPDEAEREGHRDGWTGALGNLERLMEREAKAWTA